MRRSAPFSALPTLTLLAALAAPSTPLSADIFVGGDGRIVAFYNFDDGDATPHKVWSGANTGLGDVMTLSLDLDHREIFSVSAGASQIRVFSMDVDGDVAPLRVISGAATGLVAPRGMLVDHVHDELYVLDQDADAVHVFPRGQDGDGAPLRTLKGAATTLDGPVLGTLDLVHDELVVSSIFGVGRVLVFARPTGSGVIDAAPIRSLGGPGSAISNPRAALVDHDTDRLVVTDYDAYSIRAFARTATGTAAPLQEIAGGSTGLEKPWQAMLDQFGEIVVGTDTSVTPRVVVHDVTSEGDAAPLRVLAGANTLLSNPTGIATDYARDCAWGFVVDGCLFRDNFESQDLCYWNPVVGGAGCS